MVPDKDKTPNQIERESELDRSNNERHNENARAAAAPQTITPRIHTDNL